MTVPIYTDPTTFRNSRHRSTGAALRWVRRYGTPDLNGLVEACDKARRLALELAVAGRPRNEALLKIAESLQAARRHCAVLRAAS